MRRLLITAAALLAAGCQSGWSIHGQAVLAASEAAASSDAAALGAPAAHAKVTLRCPEVAGERTVVTDAWGAFEISGAGQGPALDCVLRVAAEGRRPYYATLDEACADDGDGQGRCASAALLATLPPLKGR